MTIRTVTNGQEILAIIIPANYQGEGIKFFTPANFSQQLAYMQHKDDYIIEPHVHNMVRREVQYTQEAIVIRKGKLRVDFYDDDKNYLESHIIGTGDVILLTAGGHGFKVIEEVEMIEIKQGPYAGEKDKTLFSKINEASIRIVKEYKEEK